MRRFKLIDVEFRRLAPRYPNTVVINRDQREFHDRAGLRHIIEAAGLPPFREVLYRQTDRYESSEPWSGWRAATGGAASLPNCDARAPSRSHQAVDSRGRLLIHRAGVDHRNVAVHV